MKLILVSVLGIFIGILLMVFALRKHRKQTLEEVQRSLAKLVALKDVLIHIQQHRGLSTSVLHGDDLLKENLLTKKNTIHALCQSLVNRYPELLKDALFEGIYNHWQRLDKRCLELSASNNIVQHNRLITNLLYLIENQAEENRLLMQFTREAELEVIWKELLETIEAIGQTRAIGMGLISEGKSTAVERIQLKYLSDKVCSRLKTLSTSLAKSVRSNPYNESTANVDSERYITAAQTKITELQTFIDESLLKHEIKGISGEHFFQLASSAIEPLDTLFNISSNRIKELCR